MKLRYSLCLLPFAFLLLPSAAGAQDTIIKKNGDIIRAKITEIGIE